MKCCVCDHETAPPDSVVLWDGRTYCRGCVDAKSPDLFQFATVNPKFQEPVPFPQRQIVQRLFFSCLFIGSCFGLLFAVGGYSSLGLWPSVGILLLFSCLGLFMFLIQVFPTLMAARHVLPTIAIMDGTVEIRRGTSTGRTSWPIQSWPLGQVRWCIGKPKHDSLLRGSHFPKCSVVILEKYGERVACGWTEETQKLLIAFFELAGVKPRIPGWMI